MDNGNKCVRLLRFMHVAGENLDAPIYGLLVYISTVIKILFDIVMET